LEVPVDNETENMKTAVEDSKPEPKVKKLKVIKDENGVPFDGNTETRWKFDPDDLMIIGLDNLPTTDEALLEDGATTKIDERQVASVGRDGVLVDVMIVAKDIDGTLRPVVVDGRHRTRWARRANTLKLHGTGKSKVFVHARCVESDTTDEMLRVEKHTLNYVRANRNIMAQAQAAKELHDAGRKSADIALDLGVSVGTIENFVALAGGTKQLVDAVNKGAMPVSAAYKLAKLAPEKQAESVKQTLALAKAEPKGKTKVSHANAAKNRAKGKEDATPRPGIGKLRKIFNAAKGDEKVLDSLSECEPIDFIRWLLGEVSERVLPPAIKEVLKARKKKSAAPAE
jgi:hypothetical protein